MCTNVKGKVIVNLWTWDIISSLCFFCRSMITLSVSLACAHNTTHTDSQTVVPIEASVVCVCEYVMYVLGEAGIR